MKDFIEDRIRVLLQEFEKYIVKEKISLDGFMYKECDYKIGNDIPAVDSP